MLYVQSKLKIEQTILTLYCNAVTRRGNALVTGAGYLSCHMLGYLFCSCRQAVYQCSQKHLEKTDLAI